MGLVASHEIADRLSIPFSFEGYSDSEANKIARSFGMSAEELRSHVSEVDFIKAYRDKLSSEPVVDSTSVLKLIDSAYAKSTKSPTVVEGASLHSFVKAHDVQSGFSAAA
jgi:hypothetical protein